MIELQNVSLSYGDNIVLDKVNIQIDSGSHVCLMGPSGSGKTSLALIIAGLQKADSGKIKVSEKKISFLFQEPRLLPWFSAEENVNCVLSDDKETLEDARQWLYKMHLDEDLKKKPGEMSGGMKQRVALARALAYNGDLIILDEPLKGLDESLKSNVINILKEACADKTMILITHDIKEASELCEQILCFQNKSFVKIVFNSI